MLRVARRFSPLICVLTVLDDAGRKVGTIRRHQPGLDVRTSYTVTLNGHVAGSGHSQRQALEQADSQLRMFPDYYRSSADER